MKRSWIKRSQKPLKRAGFAQKGLKVRSKPKKPRKPSPKSLKRKLDEIYSKYLRQKEADSQGYVVCYCGAKVPWQESDCSHFVPRGCLVLRYDPRNTKASCRKCNRFMGGNLHAYAIYLEEKWGEGILQILEKERHQTVRNFPFEEKIAEYTLLLQEKEHGN